MLTIAMSGVQAVLEKTEAGKDPYKIKMWNNFADYSMDTVGASNLLDGIFSNKVVKLVLLVKEYLLVKLFLLVFYVLIYLYLLGNSSWPCTSQWKLTSIK